MEDREISQFIPYTYAYDQFTAFFYGGRVFLGGKDRPIGQRVVDIMNLDDEVLDEINRRMWQMIPAARALLKENADSAAASVQERLNAVWELLFKLPVYQDLQMDEDCYHAFENLVADRKSWARVRDTTTREHRDYQSILTELGWFIDRLRKFRQQISLLTEDYFEPLKRRGNAAYAEAYSVFYMDMVKLNALAFQEDFSQSAPVEMSFVPMMHPTNEGEVFVAEKITFSKLTDFLQTEFYRGLALGNAPRRCHNCGKYFLLTAGYNTCYCNNIAPGEAVRTCRKVGAHRKEARGKANRTPAQREYDRAYNRLKARKQRGKINTAEWNDAEAKAQELRDRSERGALTDEELKQKLEAL